MATELRLTSVHEDAYVMLLKKTSEVEVEKKQRRTLSDGLLKLVRDYEKQRNLLQELGYGEAIIELKGTLKELTKQAKKQ